MSLLNLSAEFGRAASAALRAALDNHPAIPADLVSKLGAAEVYHQVLEHRWFISEQAGYDVGMDETIRSYVSNVLAPAPHEQLTLPPLTQELPIVRELPVTGDTPLTSPP